MTLSEISNTRLTSQKIKKTEFKTAKEIVSWMGAIRGVSKKRLLKSSVIIFRTF
jgi:hypothetical protein